MIKCILATDMTRHNEILNQFKSILPVFDFSNKDHKDKLMMTMIKVSDISNEARPMDVAEPWLDCLLQEFFNQSDMEKLEGLPVSPFMDRDKVTKPSSQTGFIRFVLFPLFMELANLFPNLEQHIIDPVRKALDYYTEMEKALEKEKKEKQNRAQSEKAAKEKSMTTSQLEPKKPANGNLPKPAFVVYLESETLVTREEVTQILGIEVNREKGFHLDIEDYLSCVLTMASELSRLAVNSVTAGDYSRPLRISNFINELDSGFRLLNLKNDPLRKRYDGLKYDVKKIEEVVYDLSIRGLAREPGSGGEE
ncbi:UNVERIFIED_CONTAM: hypothetical protein FKN15_058109 [Acipenser sinensis]